jgi:hypothetical protein
MAVGLASATAASILDALANQTNYTAPTALWIQLHTADPGAAGTTAVATETDRVDITTFFAAASGGTCTTNAAITWTNVAGSEDFTHYTVWSASTNGTFYWSGTVTANAVTAGDTFTIAAGDLDLSISTAS